MWQPDRMFITYYGSNLISPLLEKMLALAYDDDGDCIIESFDNTIKRSEIIPDPPSNSVSGEIITKVNNSYNI